MQAVVMAAGKGSRLNLINGGRPKALVEVCGKTLVDWILDAFEEVGVKRILMVVGHKKEQLKAHLADRNIEYIFNPFFGSGQVLSSFWFTLDLIDQSQDLLFCHGDTIFDPKILERLITSQGDVLLPYDDHVCDEEAMKVHLDDLGHIVEINKTMPISRSDGEFIGLALIRQAHLKGLVDTSRDIIDAGSLDAYFEHALQSLHDFGLSRLSGLNISGLKWREIDFPKDLEAARSFDW